MAVGDWSTVYVHKYFSNDETKLNVEIDLRDYSDGFPWRNPKFVYCIKSVEFGSQLRCNIIPQHITGDKYKFIDTYGNTVDATVSWVALEVD